MDFAEFEYVDDNAVTSGPARYSVLYRLGDLGAVVTVDRIRGMVSGGGGLARGLGLTAVAAVAEWVDWPTARSVWNQVSDAARVRRDDNGANRSIQHPAIPL